jgi:hypothetical protein
MRTIRASEIGTYLYCARAWWYQRTGAPNLNDNVMQEGTAYHARHGQRVTRAGSAQRAGGVLLLAALLLLAVGITLALVN